MVYENLSTEQGQSPRLFFTRPMVLEMLEETDTDRDPRYISTSTNFFMMWPSPKVALCSTCVLKVSACSRRQSSNASRLQRPGPPINAIPFSCTSDPIISTTGFTAELMNSTSEPIKTSNLPATTAEIILNFNQVLNRTHLTFADE